MSVDDAIEMPVDSRPDSGTTRLDTPSSQKGVRFAPGTVGAPMDESATVQDTFGRNDDIDYFDTEAGRRRARKKTEYDDKHRTKGCWYYFVKIICGVWATREMNVENDPEEHARTTVRELVIYTIFVFNLSFITFGMASAQIYFYTTILKSLFSGAMDVSDPTSFWNFIEGDFLQNLYWEYKYAEGSDANFICPGGDEGVGPCPQAPMDRNILFENRLLGVPRLRQIQVKNGSCDLHPDIQLFTKTCLPAYEIDLESNKQFGYDVGNDSTIHHLNYTSLDAWRYQSQEELGGVTHTGLLATYSGGGYVQKLNSIRNTTRDILHELREGIWITRATRLVTVDFTVYNANLNYFCIIKLVFEFPATGGVVPSLSYKTVKLLRYVSKMDYFVMACEFILAFFLVYYGIEEFIEIKANSIFYFGNIWNILDVVVIVITGFMLGFVLITFLKVENEIGTLLGNPDDYADFTNLAFWASLTENITSMAIFFGWIKFLKYVSFNRTMTQLTRTLQRAGGDLAGFGVMFVIVFISFSQTGYMMLGHYMQDYSTLTDSIFSLLRIILGDFDWDALQKTEPFLGPLYFLTYVMAVFFIMLNMFLAIINDTYAEVKEEIASRAISYDISDYFKRGYNNWLETFGTRDKAIDIENALKMANADGIITFSEVRQLLRRNNFSDIEIEVLFSQYDKDGDGDRLMATEAEKIIGDLDDDDITTTSHKSRPQSSDYSTGSDGANDILGFNDEYKPGGSMLPQGVGRSTDEQLEEAYRHPGPVTMDELKDLTNRIDFIEESLGVIIERIDDVFNRMTQTENTKARKRAQMDSIFNAEGGIELEAGEFQRMQEEAATEDAGRGMPGYQSSDSDLTDEEEEKKK